MEDDFKEKTAEIDSEPVKNGEMPSRESKTESVSNENITKNDVTETVQLNGDTHFENDSENAESSDQDNLVIDENPQRPLKKRKRLGSKSKNDTRSKSKSSGFKGFKKLKTEEEILEPLSNPYFNESIIELSELHQKIHFYNRKLSNSSSEGTNSSNSKDIEIIEAEANNFPPNLNKKDLCKKGKKNSSPKLREYAQYLGLQPTVQFKCPKCSQSGFPSLALLNEHRLTCNEQLPQVPSSNINSSSVPSTNFRVTRKVFLCSACGTYYENWNLFLHMREVHRRFICLYCLGMFSHSEKLSLHLVSKHNCVPNKFTSTNDFFQLHKEPCFLVCCDCERAFSEQDDFVNHVCEQIVHAGSEAKSKYNLIKNNANQKLTLGKGTKQAKSKNFIGHVTADSHFESDIESSSKTNREYNQSNDEANENKENEKDINSDIKETFMEESESKRQENLLSEENQNQNISETIKNAGEEKTSDSTLFNPSDSDNLKNNFDSSQSQDDSQKSFEETESSKEKADKISNLNASASQLNIQTITDQEENKNFGNEHCTSSVTQSEFENSPEMLGEIQQDLEDSMKSFSEDSQFGETRKVPKVTLKLPKAVSSYTQSEQEESDDSEKLNLELEPIEKNTHIMENIEDDEKETKQYTNEQSLQIAGPDVPVIELELEQPLDKFQIRELLQKCLQATVPTCVYCNHARKIAVNGKQLGLHAIAEHRFSAVVKSITEEELNPESFVARIKEGLHEIENCFFNLESSPTDEAVTFSHTFECFQCRFSTTVHKELYLHNRKMHAKTILLCIMCKSNFYSYSELICHLCPGIYALDDVSFRCCMCVSDDLPSAFRLMVHLRKRHHACDVCLDLCHNQSKLSNHVWKHKLHHLCYRCGIAYRNKPDITKHLFWKHGTESVLCKKCLQKKWPHVYHFCIPPSTFTCEECNLNFTRAVALKVHKRIHSNEKKHVCGFENCTESFISKKLLTKHELKHREPPEETSPRILDPGNDVKNSEAEDERQLEENEKKIEEPIEKEEDKSKPRLKVDVYDLPELNLSESDSSDSGDENQETKKSEIKEDIEKKNNEENENKKENENIEENELKINDTSVIDKLSDLKSESKSEAILDNELQEPVPVLENIWDDFKNYQANKKKLENLVTAANGTAEKDKENVTEKLVEAAENASKSNEALEEERQNHILYIINQEHDYCLISKEQENQKESDVKQTTAECSQNMDHDYCSPREQAGTSPSKLLQEVNSSPTAVKSKTDKQDSSSDSSSESDSSSCTCGSNCSCSSSSGSSSSSSDSSDSDSSTSEGRRRQQARRERAKGKGKNKSKEAKISTTVDVVATDNQRPLVVEPTIEESDLDTTESETDEDFYDKQPQKIAKELLAKKKEKLMMLAGMGPLVNGSVLESSRPSTPSLPETEEVKMKKKSKNKKRKRKNRKHEQEAPPAANIPSTSYQMHQTPSVAPLTLTLTRNSPLTVSHTSPTTPAVSSGPPIEIPSIPSAAQQEDTNTRASKRRRVPNKFYGYSSDEEDQKRQPPVLKWRKSDLPSQSPKPAPNSPMLVPPITIKTAQPTMPPYDSYNTNPQYPPPPQPSKVPQFIRSYTPPQATLPSTLMQGKDSGSESNESSSEEEQSVAVPPLKQTQQTPLYCYCRCPYDEVSEMIGCDASDCAIEWFHFECVGIMVPPKGQWFCPDCRKKKQQKKELQV